MSFWRRWTASVLCAALIMVSPGVGCYEVLGQIARAGRGRSASVSMRAGLPALKIKGLSLPVSLTPLGPSSLSPSLQAPSIIQDASVSVALPVSGLAPAPVDLVAPVRKKDVPAAVQPQTLIGSLTAGVSSALGELAKPGLGSESIHRVGMTLVGEAVRTKTLDAQLPIAGEISLSGSRAKTLRSSHGKPVRDQDEVEAPARSSVLPASKTDSRKGVVSRWLGKARRAVAIASMAAALTLGGFLNPAVAQVTSVPVQNGPVQEAPAAAPTQTRDTVGVVRMGEEQTQAQAEVSAEVRVLDQGGTIGENVRISVTLTNDSPDALTIPSLSAAFEQDLPWTVELLPVANEESVTLAPGQTVTREFTITPFDGGDILVEGEEITIAVFGSDGSRSELKIGFPTFTIEVASVLTPGWEDEGFKDFSKNLAPERPDFIWISIGLIGLGLLISLLRAGKRQKYPGPGPGREPLLKRINARIETLQEAKDVPGEEFYGELYSILSDFLTDFRGLSVKERSAEELIDELGITQSLTAGQMSVVRELAKAAEQARFAGVDFDAEARRKDLIALREFVKHVAHGQSPSRGGGMWALLGLIPAGAAFSFANPWALVLLVPVAGYLVWSLVKRRAAHGVSSASNLPKTKSARQYFKWLPQFLRAAVLTVLVTAVAGPQLGLTRNTSYIPSTDTITVTDLSGSMSSKFDGDITKLEAAANSVEGYIIDQRKGTTNRIGMVTFADEPYLDIPLTNDYDALISHLKELRTSGSTAIGKGMMEAVQHFLETNIEGLEKDNPAFQELVRILETDGLKASLEYAKSRGLMDQVLQPERGKIIVVFSDGESNAGITPIEAATLIKNLNDEYGLNMRVYTVGIGHSGASGFDEETLQEVARLTGGKYNLVSDAQRMKEVLLEISSLEKNDVKILSSVQTKDFNRLLAMLAFLFLFAELSLRSTKLRSFPAFALMAALPLANMQAPPVTPVPAAPTAIERFVNQVPAQLAEANVLYEEGRYEEAVLAYSQAAVAYPDMPEIFFNLGNTYIKLGQLVKAKDSWERALATSKDPAVASKALFNLGNAALMEKDLEGAIEKYREALRKDPTNAEVKWNLEIAMKIAKDQDPGKGKGKGKGEGEPKDGEPKDGDPSDQEGKPGDKPGKPGEKPGKGKPGDGKGEGKPGESDAVGDLIDEQGKKEAGEAEGKRGSITRKGKGVWGMAGLPLAFMGTSMSFGNPIVLWGLAIALPMIGGLLVYAAIKKLRAAQKLKPMSAPKSLRKWPGFKRFLLKTSMVLMGLSMIIISAADPVAGTKDQRINFGGTDIFLGVDASHSMIYAEDGRLDKTKAELRRFIQQMEGADRVGLVVFAGDSKTALPLTIDYGIFDFKVQRHERESAALKEGSDLVAAVEHAAKAFESAKKIGDRPRILIVISDGDFFGQELQDAVAAARGADITIYAIGIGSPAGVKMKVPTKDGSGTEYLIDEETGQPALTSLNEGALRVLTSATGGSYFRATEGSSIDRIMEKIAVEQKGEVEDTIKEPRKVAPFFFGGAMMLLLLETLLPGVPLLPQNGGTKRAQKVRPKKKSKKTAYMGAALLPLVSWPHLFPYLAILSVVTIYLFLDLATGGSFSRQARWSWQRWRKIVSKGMAEDAGRLFDRRELDSRRVASFITHWQKADDGGKEAFIGIAAKDDALWRELMIAAILNGNKPAIEEKLFTALRSKSKERIEPPAEVLEEVLAQRENLSWLNHPDSARRLVRLASELGPWEGFDAHLAKLAAYPDTEVAATALLAMSSPRQIKKTRRSWGMKLATSVAGVLMTLSILFAGYAGVNTIDSIQRSEYVQIEATRILFGEDMYIFTDTYVDSRIETEVLPVLRQFAGSSAPSGLVNALEVLRTSHDPKADNILEFLLKKADFMPLNQEGEELLLTVLIERENPELWKNMAELTALAEHNPKSLARIKTMISLSVAGSTQDFEKVFTFLKSPNQEISETALAAIKGVLVTEKSEAAFLGKLSTAQEKFGDEPQTNLWIATLVIERLAANGDFSDLVKAQNIIDQTIADGSMDASDRQKIVGEGGQPGPSALLKTLTLMGETLETNPSAALEQVTLHTVNKNITAFIKEAEGVFSGLHDRLVQSGVVKPDSKSSYGGHPGDPYGYEYEDYGGYYGTTQNYRSLYKLKHVRTIQDAIERSVSMQPTVKEREFMTRAQALIAEVLKTAPVAGMLGGDSVGEMVAERVNPVLHDGYSTFNGSKFYDGLVEAGIAPRTSGSYDQESSYSETYKAADLFKIRSYIDGVVAGGKGWDYSGRPADLDGDERIYLAKAVEAIDHILLKNYPENLPAAYARTPGGLLAEAKDPAALTLAKTQALQMVIAQPEMLNARLTALAERNSSSVEVQLWALEVLIDRLDPAAEDTVYEAVLFEKIVNAAAKSGDDRVWTLLKEAVEQAPVDGALREIVQDYVQDRTKVIKNKAESSFSMLKSQFVKVGLRYTTYSDRNTYKGRHLSEIKSMIEAEAKRIGTLSDEQKIAVANAQILETLRAVGEAAGIASGDTMEDRVGERIIAILNDGYMKFTGQTFLQALQAESLSPERDSYDRDESYFQTYKVETITEIRDFLVRSLNSGMWVEFNGEKTEMEEDEVEYFEDAIKRLDEVTVEFYGKDAVKKKTTIDAEKVKKIKDGFKDANYVPRSQSRDGYHEDEYDDYDDWDYGHPGYRGSKYYGIAPMGLALFDGGVSMALWVLLGGLALWGVTKLWNRWKGEETAPPAKKGLSDEVRERYSEIDLSAKRFANSAAGGSLRSMLIGPSGTDFAEAAPYQDEDVRLIDWKTTAKKDALHVKKFEEEREMPLMLMVDLSPSAGFGTVGEKRRAIEDATATLALAAARQNVRVGLIIFSDGVEDYLPVQSGEAHAWRIIDKLLAFEPEGRGTDLNEPLDHAASLFKSRGMVILLSDLLTNPDFGDALSALRSQHDVRVIRVTDPADINPLPDVGMVRLQDGETGEIREVDTSNPAFRAANAAQISQHEHAIEKTLGEAGIIPLSISTEQETIDALLEEFHPNRQTAPSEE